MGYTVITTPVQCQPSGFDCETGKLAVHLVGYRPLCGQHSPYDVTPVPAAPSTPPVAPATPSARPNRWSRRLVKGAVAVALGFAIFHGCSSVVSADAEHKAANGTCLSDAGHGSTATCTWTGPGRDFISYDYGRKIVYTDGNK